MKPLATASGAEPTHGNDCEAWYVKNREKIKLHPGTRLDNGKER